MSPRRLHLRICGLVQGVSFRWATEREARRLGVSGWVRNRADGSVEALGEGPEPALLAWRDFCRRGPPGALVEKLEESWGDATGEFTGFETRR